MKVLYFLPSLEIGGAERSILNLLTFHRGGISPSLLTFQKTQPFWRELRSPLYFLEHLGIAENQIQSIFSDKHIRYALQAARQIDRFVQAERFDLVVGVLHVGAFLLALAKDAYRLRVPVVANLRGDATAYFRAEASSLARRVIEQLLLRYLCNRADAIVVPSAGVRRDLVGQYRVPETKVYAVYNALDLERVRRRAEEARPLPWAEGPLPVVLGAGRLDSQKAFHVLIEACALLFKRFPARLVILGEGGERGRLEQLAATLGIADRVSLPGYVENPFPAMRAASVFALSSMYEGFGNVLLEAMACGCPVVSTDCPSGPGEIVQHGENGLLAPMDDPHALAEAIHRVLSEERLRQRLIQGGSKRIEAFSIPAMVEGYEQVYRKLAPERGSEGREVKGLKAEVMETPEPSPPPVPGIEVRCYRPGDEAGIVRLFQTAFNKEMTLPHWRWKYQGQGYPRTYAAVAVDEEEGIVAHYGGVPLRMVHQGRPTMGLAIGDVMVHPKHRGMFLKGGLFKQVATLIRDEGVKDGFIVGYGFPGEKALRLLEKLGLCERAEEVVEAQRPVRFHHTPTRYFYELFPMDWLDERIDRLWNRVGPTLGLAVVRDRPYLFWRFKRHPLCAYQLWGLRRRWSRRLAGWAVVRDMGETLYIMDLLFDGSPLPLLEKLDNMAATAGKPAMTLWLPPRYHGVLEAHGFTLKPTGIVIPRTTHPGTLPKEEMQGKFYYTLGDFDVF